MRPTAKQTSRLFDCWWWLYEQVSRDGLFTAHPSTGETPKVAFGGDPDQYAEMVTVPGINPDLSAQQEWATVGTPGKDEVFFLTVRAWSLVPGMTDVEQFERIRYLHHTIEAQLRDQDTGQQTRATDVGAWLCSVVRNRAVVGPFGSEGFGGQCEIDVQFSARI